MTPFSLPAPQKLIPLAVLDTFKNLRDGVNNGRAAAFVGLLRFLLWLQFLTGWLLADVGTLYD